MGVLSGDDIRKAVDDGVLVITPYEAEHIGTASIDLRLGNEVGFEFWGGFGLRRLTLGNSSEPSRTSTGLYQSQTNRWRRTTKSTRA
jgi:hypothetical protein